MQACSGSCSPDSRCAQEPQKSRKIAAKQPQKSRKRALHCPQKSPIAADAALSDLARLQLIGEAMHRAAECEQQAAIGTVHASPDVLSAIGAYESRQAASGGGRVEDERGERNHRVWGLGYRV